MANLITLLFQGEIEADGSGGSGAALSGSEAREVVHSAFPMTPPRDATAREDFRAWKTVPLTSGRLLLSTVVNRGDQDEYGRPVLRANGCLLAADEINGALRDPTAVWQALETWDRDRSSGAGADDFEAFARRVEASSIHSAPEAFALFSAELERDGDFHSRAAAVLAGESADLFLGDAGRALDLLRPAFGLLPLECLRRLHLAIGAEESDSREPVLGLDGGAPEEWRQGGLLSRLLGTDFAARLGRKKEGQSDAAADFELREVYGTRDRGPAALAEAIADPRPWPLGLEGQDRYRLLLECLDTGKSPFEAVPELEELRLAVQRLEDLADDLGRWP